MRVKVSFRGNHLARNFELFDRYESRNPAQPLASVVMGKHMETKRNYLPGEIRKMKVRNSLLTRNKNDLKYKTNIQGFGMIY